MQHSFEGPNGDVEVALTKDGDAFCSQGFAVRRDEFGRFLLTDAEGHHHIAHATKVGDTWWVHAHGQTLRYTVVEAGATHGAVGGGLIAPMPGTVLDVLVKVGQTVHAGDTLMVLEAMKMEHRIVAASDGVVSKIHFAAGERVSQGAALLEIEESN